MSRSDRADAAMLALPVLLVALTIAVARLSPGLAPNNVAGLTPNARHALTGLPPSATPIRPVQPPQIGLREPEPTVAVVSSGPTQPVQAAVPAPPEDISTANPPLLAPPAPPVPVALVETQPPADLAIASPPPPVLTARGAGSGDAVRLAAEQPDLQVAAIAAPPAAIILPPSDRRTATDLPGGPEALQSGLSQCRFEPEPAQTPLPVAWSPADPDSFGLALAAAARRQLSEFVIYNDRYTRLKYPMGDVHPMYGVCTDVIIRAYRTLGIDLQELVQKTKTGSGDPNIDHRRVDTLRKFFSRFGQSLPISTFAEDYKAGDIVTYWRPQNRHSRTHIAVVSDMTGPSGRPLIIHNRGWGPQQEDALFVDEITGHYRFGGLKSPPSPGSGQAALDAEHGRKHPMLPVRPLVRTNLSP